MVVILLLLCYGALILLYVADFDTTFTVTDEVIAAIDPKKVEILQRYINFYAVSFSEILVYLDLS